MTNRMRVVFVMATTVAAVICLLMSTQSAINIADRLLSAIGNALSLHDMPAPAGLVVLAIPGLYLYLTLRRRKHS